MSEWMPIETAPKDGRYIIIAVDGILPDIVSWRPLQPSRKVNGTLFLEQPAGWFNVSRSRIIRPTHWMPLPEPPA